MSVAELKRHPWISLHASSKSNGKHHLHSNDSSTPSLNISKHIEVTTSSSTSSNEVPLSSPISVLDKISDLNETLPMRMMTNNNNTTTLIKDCQNLKDDQTYLKSALKSDNQKLAYFEKEVKFSTTTINEHEMASLSLRDKKENVSIRALHEYFSRKSDYNNVKKGERKKEMEDDVINRIPSYAFFPQCEDRQNPAKQGNRELTGTRMSFAEKCMRN